MSLTGTLESSRYTDNNEKTSVYKEGILIACKNDFPEIVREIGFYYQLKIWAKTFVDLAYKHNSKKVMRFLLNDLDILENSSRVGYFVNRHFLTLKKAKKHNSFFGEQLTKKSMLISKAFNTFDLFLVRDVSKWMLRFMAIS